MDSISGLSFPELSVPNVTILAVFISASAVGMFFLLGRTEVMETAIRIMVRWSGMRVKYVDDPDSTMRYFYAEKGQYVEGQSTMILLPSFSVDHYMWALVVQNFPAWVHVVAFDLPGHGLTPEPEEGECVSFKSQVKHIRRFLALLGLDKQPVHLTGLSMAASTAGIFAAEHPELTSSVSITCPSMKTPIESCMILENKDRIMANGGVVTLENCPILPQNGREFKEMLDVCVHYGFYYPKPILDASAKLRVRDNDFNLRAIREILTPESSVMLEESCHRIVCPSQVIWGKEDKVVHPSGAALLMKKLANCKSIDIIPECGHVITLDRPSALAKAMLDFWTQYKDVKPVQMKAE